MTPSRIEMHIERLTLEGFSLTGAQSSVLKSALEQELGRLLTEAGLSDALANGVSLQALPPLSASLSPAAPPALLGREIARTVAAAFSPGSPRGTPVEPGSRAAGIAAGR